MLLSSTCPLLSVKQQRCLYLQHEDWDFKMRRHNWILRNRNKASILRNSAWLFKRLHILNIPPTYHLMNSECVWPLCTERAVDTPGGVVPDIPVVHERSLARYYMVGEKRYACSVAWYCYQLAFPIIRITLVSWFHLKDRYSPLPLKTSL